MKSLLMSIARIAVACIVVLGALWLGAHPEHLPAQPRTWLAQDKSESIYQQGRAVIKENYYRPLNEKELDQYALQGVSALDPYSEYLSGKELEQFRLSSSGQYAGIGVTLDASGRTSIIQKVTVGSPAEKAGLRAGDRIDAVDGEKVTAMTPLQLADNIRGPVASKVKMTLTSKTGKVKKAEIVRAAIAAPVVESKTLKDNIGYVSLASFSDTSGSKVRDAVQKHLKQGHKNIILDLRGNGGGRVDQAVDIAALFLPKGSTVVKLKTRYEESAYKTQEQPIDNMGKLVVLTDNNSASASEILAGALQESKRAKLVGQHTYGKGVFQNTYNLGDGLLKLTVGSYYTAKGKNLGHGIEQGSGLAPDVKAQDNPLKTGDEQLQAAIKSLG